MTESEPRYVTKLEMFACFGPVLLVVLEICFHCFDVMCTLSVEVLEGMDVLGLAVVC